MTFSRLRVVLPLGFTVVMGACTSIPRIETESRVSIRADVTSDDIQRAPLQSVEEIIAGRVAGVAVSRAGNGTIRVRIRGAASMYSEPVYVVDGLTIHPGPQGIISAIERNDIESIEVLKDPADTALYGLRGANGVIVIKTKLGQPAENGT